MVAILVAKGEVPGWHHFHLGVPLKAVLNFQGKSPLDDIFDMCPAHGSASLLSS